ncbi:MAG: penicillin-binding transpeptidase domain-containing protein, partial [Actinomycetia bacterium]|nr:penicillin-binding transpeptidase domain-containing protein [Actinomycetes bacterium]
VAMDIEDGGILAMSSWPTFDPELFTNGISQDLWDSLNAKNSNYPLMNRVTSGTYPAASTFKAFISLAGFYYGLITADTTSYCRGYWTDYGEEWGQYCWLHSGHGTLVFEEAINQSCDVFFYNLAKEFYERWRPPAGVSPLDRVNELQDYLRSFGFGSVTGLDGCTESYGRVPDAAWKRWAFRDTPEEAGWNPGDMTNMSIGQGDILVTPLQICNGYAGIARRKMLKPHIFQQTLDAYGHIQVSYQIRESDQQPQFEEENVKRLEEGFRRVVARNGGPFNQLGVQVLGKTGTGEIASAKETCSWFVAYAPAEAPKYCVACVAEQAGTGDSVAMQAVQFTLGAIYGVDLGPVHAGQGTKER